MELVSRAESKYAAQQSACRTAYLGAAASMFSTASGVVSSRPRAAAGFLGAGLGAALALAGRLAGAAGRLGAATGRLQG
jgi:hypothetical protein